jgi:predicted Zn finger-like uncharacterized protein
MNRMRIACPSCGAEYEVPDRLLAGASRTLRCSRCAADFALPRAAPEAAAPPPVLAEAPPPPPPVVAPPAPKVPPAAPPVPGRMPLARPPDGDAALRRAWGASVAVVLGGLVALVLFRAQVMSAWPPTTRLFMALGLA